MRRYLEGLEHTAKMAKASEKAEAKKTSLTSGLKGFFHDKFLQTKAFALNTLDASPIARGVKTVWSKEVKGEQDEPTKKEETAPTIVFERSSLSEDEELEAYTLMQKGLKEYDDIEKEAALEIEKGRKELEEMKQIKKEEQPTVIDFLERKQKKEAVQEIEEELKVVNNGAPLSKISANVIPKVRVGTANQVMAFKGKEVLAGVAMQRKLTQEEKEEVAELEPIVAGLEESIMSSETTVFDLPRLFAEFAGQEESFMLTDENGQVLTREGFVRSKLAIVEQMTGDGTPPPQQQPEEGGLTYAIAHMNSYRKAKSPILSFFTSIFKRPVKNEVTDIRQHSKDNTEINKWIMAEQLVTLKIDESMAKTMLEKLVRKHIGSLDERISAAHNTPDMPA